MGPGPDQGWGRNNRVDEVISFSLEIGAEFFINLRDRSKLHRLMAKLNGMSSRPSREFGLHLQIRLAKEKERTTR